MEGETTKWSQCLRKKEQPSSSQISRFCSRKRISKFCRTASGDKHLFPLDFFVLDAAAVYTYFCGPLRQLFYINTQHTRENIFGDLGYFADFICPSLLD